MAIAYEGDKPYIFISYSHKDTDIVMTAINALQKEGFAVWFDGGIEAGSEWPEYIASHLRNCACALTFISKNFVVSDNCRRELNFAQDIKKPLLNIYIDDVELSDGMKMQLGLNQALHRDKFTNDEEFFASICNARLIQPCKVCASAKEQNSSAEPDPRESFYTELENELRSHGLTEHTVKAKVKEYRDYLGALPLIEAERKISSISNISALAENIINNSEKDGAPERREHNTKTKEPDPHPGMKKALGWIGALAELSYIFLGYRAIDTVTGSGAPWWQQTLFMMIPHVALALLIILISKIFAKKLTISEKNGAMLAPFMCYFPATIIAIIAGAAKVHVAVNFILRLLISLGLNVIPALIVIVMLAFQMGKDEEE